MSLGKRLAIRYIRTKFRLLARLSPAKAAEKAFELFCTPQHRNRKALSPVFDRAEKLSFPFQGQTVRGFRWQPEQPSGKTLLILHGFESSIVNFDRYVKPLLAKGYVVLGFDAPAHGVSTGKTINVLQYKGMVEAIYRQYGPIQAFLAHSFGGLCVSLFLEETPHTETDKVVLIAPAVETRTAADQFFRFLHLGPEVRTEFDAHITRLGSHPPGWYSVARAAPSIKAQVLFLQDTKDEMTPYKDVVPIIEANHPNFRFIISEGLGHRRIYRDASSMEAILSFL